VADAAPQAARTIEAIAALVGARIEAPAGFAVSAVVEGLETVDQMLQVPTGPGGPFKTDVPAKLPVIEKVTILGGR
jgi:hypothetical protein